MRKEITIAIFLGVILGLIIIFGIKFANQGASVVPTVPAPSATSTINPSITPEPILQIISPKNNQVSFQANLQISGKTKPNADIGLIWENGEAIIKANEAGDFEQEIELIGGENLIRLTAAAADGYQESVELTVIYTTAEINTSTPNTATSSADQINQNIIKRLEKRVALTGYFGQIGNINNLNLVIKDRRGKTLQIVTAKDTDIIRNGQNINLNSLSIGENIIVIGQLNSQDILVAKRIVTVKNVTPTSSRQIIVDTFSNLNVKGPTLDIGEIPENQTVLAIIETDLKNNTNTILAIQPLLQ